GRPDRAGAMAGFARIEARDLQLFHRAAHRIPKVNFNLIFERTARFSLFLDTHAAPASAEKLAEKVAKTCPSPGPAAGRASKIESAKVKIDVAFAACGGPVLTGRNVVAVEAVLVVDLSLLGVRQYVVGFLQLLELFLGRLVAGIEVGMEFARELA